MKNNMSYLMLACALMGSGCYTLKGAAPAPAKVGIKQHEVETARELARRTGFSELYEALGGKGAVKAPQKMTQVEVDQILWPVLVWAIEENKMNLVKTIMPTFIMPNDKKPYGRAVTPLEIAEYQGKPAIKGYMTYLVRVGEGIDVPVPLEKPSLSLEEMMEKDPWGLLIRAIENGDVNGVRYIIKTGYINVGEKRNAPGLPSHKKSPIDIANFNMDRSVAGGYKELANKQQAIIDYLEGQELK